MVSTSAREGLEAREKNQEEKFQRLDEVSHNDTLPQNVERYRVLAETAREGVFILENGCCIEANSSGCEMFGYSYEEIIGREVTSVFVSEYQDLITRMMTSGKEEPYEAEAIRKDGFKFFVEIVGRNYLYHGRKVRVTSVIDISSRKRAEQAILQSESKYREVIENAADGILIGDLEGIITDVNGGFLKMTGYARDDLIGQHISILFDPSVMKDRPLRFDLLDKGESVILERHILDKEGSVIPVEMNSKRSHASYYLTVIRDLRERRKAENDLYSINKQLKLAKEKAEESDRLKSAFLANMSHEIRTPLNGVIGFADLLRNKNLPPDEWDSFINIIISSSHQLLSIINDVLAISRIETGQVKLNRSPVNLIQMMKELHLFFRPVANDTHNQLVVSGLDDVAGFEFYCDGSKIRQIFTNLINNALKFTVDGTVTFGVNLDNQWVHFFVNDTGIGIPEKSLSSIFERFVQVYDNGPVAQAGGAGLGLAICKKLVELMGGEIWVHSKPGEGSEFHFMIPVYL